MLSGVPQGSVLGPLLFLIYANTIAEGSVCKWYAYADDYKLYLQYRKGDHQEIRDVIQTDLTQLSLKSSSWNLKLNADKCVVIRFGAKYESGDQSGYFLGGSELKLVRSHRDLGVIVDSALKFHEHIDSIVCKAAGLANQLLRATVCREPVFMVKLFVSHIRPLLDYCSCVWNLGYVGDTAKLERVQRRWTKQVEGMYETSYESRLRQLGLYSIRGRLLRGDLIKIWKTFHTDTDVGLGEVFDRQSHRATRGHRFKLSIPRCRTEVKRRFFNVRCVSIWNSLPPDVPELETLEKFKTKLDLALSELFYGM